MKYSIIIPVKNSIKYLPSLINSIISQKYTDYEIIISDDHSEDGTAEYIDTLVYPNLIKLHTEREMLVNEHFDFAQSHASGDWQMFIGGDDAIQPYFFKLADFLTEIAKKENIEMIASERSYFFWPGCEKTYGDIKVIYSSQPNYSIKTTKNAIKFGLYEGEYHNLPTMYTTSLFNKNLINLIRKRQSGKLILGNISDAFLCATGCIHTKKYLFSKISLSWVGTSPDTVYRPKSVKKKLELPQRFGNYSLGTLSIYFWMGLCLAEEVWKGKSRFSNKYFLYHYLAYLYTKLDKTKYTNIRDITTNNNCNYNLVLLISKLQLLYFIFYQKIITIVKFIMSFLINKSDTNFNYEIQNKVTTYEELEQKSNSLFKLMISKMKRSK